MVFTELRFLFFFVAVFAVYWGLRTNGARKVFLLLASYVFYGAWDWRFLSLIFLSTGIDYAVGRALAHDMSDRARKRWLLVSVVANLSVLGFFKYYNFFVGSAAATLAWLGLPTHVSTLEIILPLGISFYTFQSMSYTIDVYYRKTPTKGLLDFSLYVSFFPQLVAGPIVRAIDFLPQLERKRVFADVRVRFALGMFLVGYIKKACVADNIAPIVDLYFAHPDQYDVAGAWIGILFYAVQIYCDFSGYSDMAIGTAALLGYELCLNFEAPYFAAGFSDFWRRWHISLSTWLRDYLYVPLGGNRGSTAKTYRNLMLTMLLGGLWHGAAWTFVVWGLLHGIALAVERAIRGARPKPAPTWQRLWRVPLVFYAVCIAWVFFRAPDFASATVALRSFVLFESPGTLSFPPFLFGVFGVLAVVHFVAHYAKGITDAWSDTPNWLFAALYGAAFAVAIAAFPFEYRPFIYFQF